MPDRRTIQNVIAELDAFEAAEWEWENRERLDEILRGLESMPERHRAVPALFGVLERFPEAELGSPGPIVHALESISGMEEELLRSVTRHAGFYNVWMLNRLLNAEPDDDRREPYLERLRHVVRNEALPDWLRDEAREYLDHQATEPPRSP